MPEPAKDQLAALKQAIAERHYDDAIRGARKMVLESDKHPEARMLLGEALLAAGRNDEARVEMLALVRERPEEPAAHRLLGEAHLRDRQLEPARASLRRAVELDPDDEAARDLLLEADSEVAEPGSSTVERWMANAEPQTIEMAMPEYLHEAPAVTPSASLRSLLERAQELQPKLLEKKKAVLTIPRPPPGAAPADPRSPSQITAKLPQVQASSPSTDSISLELEIDLDASTGQRANPARGAPPPETTGELSIEDLVPAPLPPRPERRSQPPPPARTGATSPGAVAAPPSETQPLPVQHAGVDGATRNARKSTLMGLPAPAAPPSASGSSPGALRTPSTSGQVATPSLARPPSAPPPPRPRASAPASSPRPAGLPPSAGAGPRGPVLRALAPSARAAKAPVRDLPTSAADEAPTLPVTSRADQALDSPPTLITGPHSPAPASAGALIGPSSVDNVDITNERGAMRGRAAPPPSPSPTPAAWSIPKTPSAGGIPNASPPPKLGSMGGSLPSGVASGRPGGGVPGQVILAPVVAPMGPAPRVIASAAGDQSTLAPRQAGQAEPPTKPTVRTPGTREATQRVRLTQLTVALVLGGIVIIALVVSVSRWLDARERDEALALASDSGTEADLVRALAATEGIPATRARLFATATVELGEDRGAAAEELLAGAAPSPETSVARSLLAISRGQTTEALMMLEALEASGVTLAEGARARALALDAMGRYPEAQAAAGQAWGFRTGGPRHACLLARTAVLVGDTASADATLRAIPEAEARPCARLGRAQLALARGDLAGADSEASVVLGALAARATNAEEAWGHHLRGRTALGRGDMASARSELRQAAELAPPADETLLLRSLEGLVAAGDAAAAHEMSARLAPNAPSAARRAEVLVAIALDRRDFAAAETALRMLPPGARTELSHGRVLEARGDDTGALMRYTAAGADATLAVEAALRRARLLSRLGRDAEARAALELGARSALSDPTVAAALAHAALATDDVRAARTALEVAARSHADDPRLVALSAVLRARDGERDGPLAAARQAAAAAPEDPELQLDLAQVARLAGDRATETAACAEALRLDPRRLQATACVVRVAIDAADFPRATQLLEQMGRTSPPEPTFSRLRAELAVAEGHGQLSVDMVRGFIRTHRNDVALHVSLARLLLQTDQERAADEAALRVLALSPENPDGLYVRAYVAYLGGSFPVASGLLGRALRGARGASITARITALRGLLAQETPRFGDPLALAAEALAIDPHCGVAHFLRAKIADEDGNARRTALAEALAGTDPPAEAVGMQVMALGSTPEGCAVAERYVRMAPRGVELDDVEDVRARCP